MESLLLPEAYARYPFITDVQNDWKRTHYTDFSGLEIRVVAWDDEFLARSLLENSSLALGHLHEHKALYVVRDRSVTPVDVHRRSRCIYPPEYLHPGAEYPPDDFGWSETVGEALARVDLRDVQYVALFHEGTKRVVTYRTGGRDYWEDVPQEYLTIAEVKQHRST